MKVLAKILQEIWRSECRMEERLKKMEEDIQRGQEAAVKREATRARLEKVTNLRSRVMKHKANSMNMSPSVWIMQ